MGDPVSAPVQRVDRALPWVAALVLAAAVLSRRYPAMIDLPCHEEIVSAMRHARDPAMYPPGLMRWNMGHPNQLFYFFAAALSFVVPVDLACKVVVALSVGAVPLGAARLADHVGVSRAAAVFAAPIALGFFFYFGFVGNLLALGMLLASLPLFDDLARSPDAKGAARATAALVVLYTAHDSALVIGGVSVVVLSLGRPLFDRSTLWRIVPLAVAGALALVEEVYAVRHNGANLRALPQVIELGFDQKLDGLPQALFGLHRADALRPIFWGLGAGLLLLVAQRAARARDALTQPISRALYDANRFTVLGLSLVVMYFEVPFAYAGAMWLHARFLGPGIAILAVALAPRLPSRPWGPTRWVAAGVTLLVVRLVEPEMAATSEVYADLDPLVAVMAPGSAVAPLDLLGGPADGLVLTVAGAAARAASERGGRMAASFTQTSPIPPRIIAPDQRWEESVLRLSRDTLAFEPARDLRRFRYALAWAPEGAERKLTAALSPEAHLVARSGEWLLFESNLAVEPILAPEDPPEPAESLRDRLSRL